MMNAEGRRARDFTVAEIFADARLIWDRRELADDEVSANHEQGWTSSLRKLEATVNCFSCEGVRKYRSLCSSTTAAAAPSPPKKERALWPRGRPGWGESERP